MLATRLLFSLDIRRCSPENWEGGRVDAVTSACTPPSQGGCAAVDKGFFAVGSVLAGERDNQGPITPVDRHEDIVRHFENCSNQQSP